MNFFKSPGEFKRFATAAGVRVVAGCAVPFVDSKTNAMVTPAPARERRELSIQSLNGNMHITIIPFDLYRNGGFADARGPKIASPKGLRGEPATPTRMTRRVEPKTRIGPITLLGGRHNIGRERGIKGKQA